VVETWIERPIVPVDAGAESTLFSWNGTCPESPDGRRLAYLKLQGPAGEGVQTIPAELWICDAGLADRRPVFEMPMTCAGFPHNGAMASWIDDCRLVFRQLTGSGPRIYGLNVDTGEQLFAPLVGALGHEAICGLVPFGIYPEHVGHNPAYPGIRGEGLYLLRCGSGEVERVASTDELIAFATSRGFTPHENTRRLAHEMLNPAATKVMVRFSLAECLSLLAVDLESGEKTLLPYKPLHQLWYDDQTYAAVAGASDDPHPKREIARWAQDGTRLETLVSAEGAGVGNHIGLSPDRRWYVTDSIYHSNPVTVELYRRGNGRPVATLDRHALTRPVWAWRAHANPVFSRDGQRVYFVRPFEETGVQAVYVDISPLV
jgi:hypothetical protein